MSNKNQSLLDALARKASESTANVITSTAAQKNGGYEFHLFEENTNNFISDFVDPNHFNHLWATASFKRGDFIQFYPRIRKDADVSEEKFKKINMAIEIFSRSQDHQILSSSDICLATLRDGKFLEIHSENISDPEILDRESWHLMAEPILSSLLPNFNKIREYLSNLVSDDDDKDNRSISPTEYKKYVQEILEFTPIGAHVPVKGPKDLDWKITNDMYKQLSRLIGENYEQLAVYLSIVTAMSPSWRRIVMIPAHYSPGHLNYPGGLVICEGNDTTPLTRKELDDIQNIVSVTFWPWLPIARPIRKELEYNLPSIRTLLCCFNNDYRGLEYQFGGDHYTLTGFESRDDVPSKVIVGVEALASELRKEAPQGTEIYYLKEKEKLFLECDEEMTGSLFESVFRGIPDASHYSEPKRIELDARVNIIHKLPSKQGISIILPVLPSRERLRNLKLVLKGLQGQSIFSDHRLAPQVELIVLIDCDTSEDNEVRKEIISLVAELKRIKQRKVYYATSSELKIAGGDYTIGRSNIRNYGIKKAKKEIIQFIDDSMILHTDYLMHLLIRYEYLARQKFILVGFKERLFSMNMKALEKTVKGLIDDSLRPSYKKDFKNSERAKEFINYGYNLVPEGEEVDYMALTDNLCFLSGSEKLGAAYIPRFFSTGLSAALKSELIAVGGFEPQFGVHWGWEDTFTGALLVSCGNKIIPCYDLLAYDLSHKKDDEKEKLKTGGERITNETLFNFLLDHKSLTSYTKDAFIANSEKLEACFEKA